MREIDTVYFLWFAFCTSLLAFVCMLLQKSTIAYILINLIMVWIFLALITIIKCYIRSR